MSVMCRRLCAVLLLIAGSLGGALSLKPAQVSNATNKASNAVVKAIVPAPIEQVTRVSCYYRWMHRRIGPQQLRVLNRSPHGNSHQGQKYAACTHIILAFASVGDDFQVNLTEIGGIQGVARFVREGRPTPTTRMMLSIGGGRNEANFAPMVADPVALNTFQVSLGRLIRDTGLDGIDFDWEFPNILQAGQFARLLQQTRLTLNAVAESRYAAQRRRTAAKADRDQTVGQMHSAVTTKANSIHGSGNKTDTADVFRLPQAKQVAQKFQELDLSVAVPGSFTLTAGYKPDYLRDNCTFINVMTYDLILYEAWHPFATLHSALYGQGGLFGLLTPFSTSYAMEFWADLGIPNHMLLLGIPTYGVAYELDDASQNQLFSSVKGYSAFGANVGFDLTCRIRASHPDHVHFSQLARVPYVYDNKGNWITYDDERSVAEKATFAIQKGYGGVMIFSLNADDPWGLCAKMANDTKTDVKNDPCSERFPLTRIAARTLREASLNIERSVRS
ncbi:chitinase-3 protein 1-like [Tropilaelaps mercedesae]|uniref:Chitinase-3 protein 1-like n=1 Tax=Tropilaelaps mercedesae TaxID=418985 RepID=A0A1V9XF86_9ACAR|nr:chitinase-3 protein 1-like [Tropilaelaps mercedesae]